jgi:hypothetical protein
MGVAVWHRPGKCPADIKPSKTKGTTHHEGIPARFLALVDENNFQLSSGIKAAK